jgi:isopenicillin N synthase-like dioxygenase
MAMANVPIPLQIPIVNISVPDSEESIADQLVHAATVHGFVYIKNLGRDIPIKDIDDAFALVGLVHLNEVYVFANLCC